MQTNNILILINNNFAGIKEDTIRLAKIIIKNKKYLILIYFLKFNSTYNKFNLNKIILIKKSYIKEIVLIIYRIANFTGFKIIMQKKLLLKK